LVFPIPFDRVEIGEESRIRDVICETDHLAMSKLRMESR